MSEQKSAVYFKEYPCYHFAILDHKQLKPIVHFQLSFEGSSRKAQINPPAAIIDKLSKKDVMYLLQWKKEQFAVFLYLRRFQKEDQWVAIKMNVFPDYVNICGGSIFLLASQELHIVNPFSKQINLIPLANDLIISVNPYLVQIANQKEHKFQPGVYVLYYKDRQGYYACEYSALGTNQRKKVMINRIADYFKVFNNKSPQYLYLQVIIPNVLALAFVKQNQICLFNLQTMELMPNLNATLIEGKLQNQKPIIRWKPHQSLGNYEQTLLVMIGVGSTICSLYIMFKYNQNAVESREYSRYALSDFNSGSFIHWPQVKLKPYISYIVDGNVLVDMQITQKGLVYCSKSTSADLIGKYRYLQTVIKQGQPQYSIVHQQCTIWKYFYEDQREQNMAFEDRLLMPNRYNYQLVRHLTSKYQPNRKMQQKIFNLWRQQYKFSTFLIFQQELLIVRKGSISVYRQVNQFLFHWLNFSEEHQQQIQSDKLSKNRYQNIVNISESDVQQFQKPELHFSSLQPLIKERLYIDPEDQISLKKLNEGNQKFKNLLDILQDIMLVKHEYKQPNVTISQLKKQLISSKLRDNLCYFNLVFNSKVFILGRERQRQSNKIYEKQNFIIRLIDYFYGLYQRSSQYYNQFGQNIIDLFIEKFSKQISQDIDPAVSTLLKKLLNNLLPRQVNNNCESSMIKAQVITNKLSDNSFIQFLINLIKECADKQEIYKQELLRQQLERFLNLGFFSNKSIFFSQFCKNKSLIKALFLTNSTQLINNTFLPLLFLRNNMQSLLMLYKPLKKYISRINQTIIQTHMFFSQNYNYLQFDLNQLGNQQFYFGEKQNQQEKAFQKLQAARKITNSIIARQINTINLVKIDHFQTIRQMIKQMIRNPVKQAASLQKIEEQVEETTILDEQQQIYFYQRVLIAFVDYFNTKVEQDSKLTYLQNPIIDSQEARQFKKSRQSLSKVLGCVKGYFQKYMSCFQQLYGSSQLPPSQTTSYQQRIMTSTYLQKPLRLLNQSSGPTLSDLSVQLIFQALKCSKMNVDEEFHNSLTNFDNLIHFWAKSLPKQNKQHQQYEQFIKSFNARRQVDPANP